jgi:hypothetical protein
MTDVEACEFRKVHKEIILVLYVVMQVLSSVYSPVQYFVHLFI